jgi:hypothetical protein
VSVLHIAVVVPSSNHDAAVARYVELLETEAVAEFELPGGSLTVTVLPGISILSGDEHALTPVRDLRASIMVDSLTITRDRLERTGWVVGGTLGAPDSLLATDPDGSLFEFVEQSE